MVNGIEIGNGQNEMELEAYNAAFYELGLRWHWDRQTYIELQHRGESPAERLKHYLQTRQAHLLRAYDADFLSTAIEQRKAARRPLHDAGANLPARRSFDWAQAIGRECGA